MMRPEVVKIKYPLFSSNAKALELLRNLKIKLEIIPVVRTTGAESSEYSEFWHKLVDFEDYFGLEGPVIHRESTGEETLWVPSHDSSYLRGGPQSSWEGSTDWKDYPL